MTPLLRGLIHVSHALNRGMAGVAGVALIAMMLVLLANILMRTFASPINGTFEVVSMCAVFVFGLALGNAQSHQSHVSIGLLVNRWSKQVRIAVGSVVTIASIALFVQLATSLVIYGLNQRLQGAATNSLGIPIWPSVFAVVFGMSGLVLALFADLAKAKLAWSSDDPAVNIF
jgi:TRAP-type C4-dicarboxylate transport system permease small subunit